MCNKKEAKSEMMPWKLSGDRCWLICVWLCSGFRRRGQQEKGESLEGSLEELEGTEEEEREKVHRERYAKLKDLSLHFSAPSAWKER